jgi:HPr kinase/phosphorylase
MLSARKKINLVSDQKKGGTQKDSQRIVSGGLLRIFGLGILIIGDSGIGKSETALELVSRGHKFVSDDATVITKNPKGKISGSAPDLSKDYMEIRGLGIINVREIYGKSLILQKTAVDLVVELKKWEKGKDYDRLGLTNYGKHLLLDEEMPRISIPVAPGRNMATLIEVACKVHLLKKKGYHASSEIAYKLDRVLR